MLSTKTQTSLIEDISSLPALSTDAGSGFQNTMYSNVLSNVYRNKILHPFEINKLLWYSEVNNKYSNEFRLLKYMEIGTVDIDRNQKIMCKLNK